MLKNEHKKIEEQICSVLPKNVMQEMQKRKIDFTEIQEIRFRIGKPMIFRYKNHETIFQSVNQKMLYISEQEMDEMLDYISTYSMYAYEEELKQGFLTIEGGHRVGVAGKTILEDGRIKNIKYISSVNIRISHERKGCSDQILPVICENNNVKHTLIISPPKGGKTTLLRDLIRQISNGNSWIDGRNVGVVDERSELAACYKGVPQNDVGIRTDVLDGCSKVEGMLMLIRSMSPSVLAVDEIGAREDIRAIEYAMHSGCILLATAHGISVEELRRKPVFDELIGNRRFQRYVVLSGEKGCGEIEGIYNENGMKLC